MKRRSKTLVTLLLTGSMLLGTVSIAAAADTSNAPTVASKQPIKITLPQQQFRQFIPYRYIQANISRSQVSAVLNRLVTKETITKYQARDILKEIPRNSSVTRTQMNNLLNRLVKKDTITKAQMQAIMKRMPDNYIKIQVNTKIYKQIPNQHSVHKDKGHQQNNVTKDLPSTQQEQ